MVKTLYICRKLDVVNYGPSLIIMLSIIQQLSTERIDCGGISILCSGLEHCPDFLIMYYIYVFFKKRCISLTSVYMARRCLHPITEARVHLSEVVLCALFRSSTYASAEMSFTRALSRQIHLYYDLPKSCDRLLNVTQKKKNISVPHGPSLIESKLLSVLVGSVWIRVFS